MKQKVGFLLVRTDDVQRMCLLTETKLELSARLSPTSAAFGPISILTVGCSFAQVFDFAATHGSLCLPRPSCSKWRFEWRV